MGPVIFDLDGMELTSEEQDILQHPCIGGVILFARNYDTPKQVYDLAKHIKSIRLLPITVDQEGGRVQRFKSKFSTLPSLGAIGALYDRDQNQARATAETMGWLMATEVLSCGIDVSFAPVLDLNRGLNTVIGDRSYHREAKIVYELASAAINGMNKAGMQAIGKHYPGHGGVIHDTHHDLAKDERQFDDILSADMYPYQKLIEDNLLFGIMPAHVIYPAICSYPAGFSALWLKDILRKQLKFKGLIISDDLTMQGASVVSDVIERAHMALDAGCDRILVCNNRKEAIRVIEELEGKTYAIQPWEGVMPTAFHYPMLSKNKDWQQAVNEACQIC